MYIFPESVEAGGLLAYSFDLKEFNQQAARNIDAILRGANPGELDRVDPLPLEGAM